MLASGLLLSGARADDERQTSSTTRVREKLNLAVVGCGGRGADDLAGVSTENIVALCDADDHRAADSFQKYPAAKRYRDFRKMLEAEKDLDGVVVATPDHNHAIVAVTAMRLGKHVYCEKPLAHSVYEARLMAKVAAEHKVATQMGTQGHAFEGTRRAVEVIRAGAIGEVREVHVWSDRPIWPQGIARPKETPPVPEWLDWDQWLGPAPERPFNPAYVPFKWRGFWDFGTGAIGDMAIHNFDTAYWALGLTLPTTVEVKDAGGVNDETAPSWSIIELRFPEREKPAGYQGPATLPPVKVTWYDGNKKPPAELFQGEEQPTNGSLVIGSKGTLFTRTWSGGDSPADMFLLLPRKQFTRFQSPPKTLPRAVGRGSGEEATGHHQEWIAACKGGPMSLSNFAYASKLTESLLLANVALRVGKRIEWDAANLKAKNCPEADRFLHPEFRKGWDL